MIRLLKLLGNIVDPSWWADLIGENQERMIVQENQTSLKNGS